MVRYDADFPSNCLHGDIFDVTLIARVAFQGWLLKYEVAMRGTIRGAILRMLLAFFAGAVTMLFILAPGQVRLEDLLDQEKRSEVVDFNRAADRIERASDLTAFYAHRARRYIGDKFSP